MARDRSIIIIIIIIIAREDRRSGQESPAELPMVAVLLGWRRSINVDMRSCRVFR